MQRIVLALAICALPLGACANVSGLTAIRGATVINPRAATVSPDTTVIFRKDRIVAVQPASARIPAGAKIIDAEGKFLIPGLWDAHVHLGKLGANALSLFIANGVTGVRDMGSNLDELKKWRAEIGVGKRVGPLMMISGPMLESKANLDRMMASGDVEAAERQRIGVATPEEGRAAVRQLAAAGVDQIKMRTTPDAETFAAIGDEARLRKLPFAAHNLGAPEQMLAAGLGSVEHYLALPPLNASRMLEADRRALFRRMAAANFHVSNTVANFKPLMTPYESGRAILEQAPGAADPLRKYVCGYLVEDWREQLEESRSSPTAALAALLPLFYAEMREMADERVPMLVGTDAAVMFVYPGFSLDDELEIMVRDFRFPVMDVLRIATNGVPAYWKRDGEMGGIEAGQRADLVLLDADPLQDIANIRRIRAVVANGRWLDRAALDGLLTEVERDAGATCQGGSTLGRR